MMDICFEKNYGILCEQIQDGVCKVFDYHSQLGTIRHMFLRRQIPIQIAGVTYYDLITPFRYGGPLILNSKTGARENLVTNFTKAFAEYCQSNNIVSEFVRFHPVADNGTDFVSCYTVKHSRNTVGTNLQDYDNPLTDELSKTARKNIRRALNKGVSYRVIEAPDDLEDFKKVYYATMIRQKASCFYYFNDDYFNNCLNLFKENLILVDAIYQGKVIASGLYFVYQGLINAHLSGTLTDYLQLSPAYVIKYATILWAIKNNIKLIHYGGGNTSSKTDSLYRFKKRFGRNTEFSFKIGQKIWNKEIYQRLCQQKGTVGNTGFFPAYRGKIN